MSYQNRIVGYEIVKASELKIHPQHWRVHPQLQSHAVRTLLEEVGWVDVVIKNQRTGNLIDGKLRKDLADGQDVPVLIVDLSAEEENIVLAMKDPTGALTESDDEALERLLQSLDVNEPVR